MNKFITGKIKMSNQNIKIATVVIIAAVTIAFCGCRPGGQSKSRLDLKNEMPVKLSCVIAIDQPDGSKYFTKQKQLLYPEQKTLLFSAEEPEAVFKWSVAGSSYNQPKSAKLPPRAELMFSREISTALLELYLANTTGSIQTAGADFSPEATINIDGQIYGRVSGDKSIELYQNRQSKKIDTAKTTGKISYIIQGYNYHKIENSEIILPTKIDVFVLKAGQNKQFAAQFSIFVEKF
ncbi:MAG: hypothetical protein K8R02_05775 [Anaerohalosphaeraceae bacterium]|nr:hypothetical protein [Anaerohalosphaeraceae bacterium]